MGQPEGEEVPAGRTLATDSPGRTGVEVVGTLGHARFPELCIRCARPTGSTLTVTKLFWHERSGEDSGYYLTAGVDAPCCAECIRAHQRELRPVPPEARKRLLRKWLVEALPYLFPLGVNLWLLSVLGPDLIRALREPGDPAEILILGGVCGLFAGLAWMFYRLIRAPGRMLILGPETTPCYVQIERGPLGSRFVVPVEPTSTLRALDFTGDRSELFERERHLFTFENAEVGSRFAELNAGREWDPASPGAIRAHALRRALLIVVVLAVLYFLIQDWFF
ncbi:MAG TPA: hypothetical protein VHG28_16340 [Longimicrobiaceae bacterium]|nr:hypothetical protein [Longimicrobiaceae bacterium]